MFFRIYHKLLSLGFGGSGLLLFRLAGTPEARSCKATVAHFLFRTQATPKLRRSLGPLDQIRDTHQWWILQVPYFLITTNGFDLKLKDNSLSLCFFG
jgi:hypothetical protein